MNLNEIRAEIDGIDKKLLELFLKRMELSKAALEQKKLSGKLVLDKNRELEILEWASKNSGELAPYACSFFEELMRLSRQYQNPAQSANAPAPADSGNIVLIGMPGCGKSSVGECLARYSGKKFISIDAEIVKTAGKSIPQIFAEDGEAAFREIERKETAKAGGLYGVVIATGGGVVLDKRNYAPLHQNGRIYVLQRDVKLLDTEGRPLSRDIETLKKMELERAPLYAAFGDKLVDNNVPCEQCAQDIWTDFCQKAYKNI